MSHENHYDTHNQHKNFGSRNFNKPRWVDAHKSFVAQFYFYLSWKVVNALCLNQRPPTISYIFDHWSKENINWMYLIFEILVIYVQHLQRRGKNSCVWNLRPKAHFQSFFIYLALLPNCVNGYCLRNGEQLLSV